MSGILRNKHSRRAEPVWHLQLTMVAAIVLQLILPEQYVVASRYLIVLIEIVLLLALSFTTPREPIFRSLSRRINVLLLITLTVFTNLYSLLHIVNDLLAHGHVSNGRELILAALNIYLTNIIIFGLLYWEMDGGGPGLRQETPKAERDFSFPQDQTSVHSHPAWAPTFIDYLYVSATNGMAFSPTDTLPLSRRAKMIMLAQATISLTTIALVAARAVNILN